MWISKIVILAAGVTLMSLSAQAPQANAAAESAVSSEASAQTIEDAANPAADASST